ncbi:MAG: RnfH family protein [Pseudomonadota bacterium]
MNEEKIQVEVVYGTKEKQLLMQVDVNKNATIEDAIRNSGILGEFPEIDLEVNKVGVFSKLAKLDKVLKNKDRVEIYRKLIADPKEVRKQRAAAGKRMKKGGGKE